MKEKINLIIVGAGPAGMAAAIEARAHGLSVLVVDDQPAPGGQVWRAVERTAEGPVGKLLGEEYRAGSAVVRRFRSCGAIYQPLTQVWQIEEGWHCYMTRDGKASVIQADNVLLATGAQERPAPFPGWTLPGVMTVGAAQISLKASHQVPATPVWVAGSGPLVLLYLHQLLRAGGKIAGWLDTAPLHNWRQGLRYLPAAIENWGKLYEGHRWSKTIRKAAVQRYSGVSQFSVEGADKVSDIVFRTADGVEHRAPADLVLIHEGVVPSIHVTRALGCQLSWNAEQRCFVPALDDWGATDQPGIYVAGDGAGIAGAHAAYLRGQCAGLAVAVRSGKLPADKAETLAKPIRKQLAREYALRPMLDAMFPPRANITCPSDSTIVCRCEELSAGTIRDAAKMGQPGPNQIKAFTRAGMGPCQGRQCGYTIANILAQTEQRPTSEVGFFRIRPPLKPLTLGELAALTDNGNDQ